MTAKKRDDFETRLERLKMVVEQLEAEDLALDKGVALYKEGLDLVKSCRTELRQARNEIQLAGGGELDLDETELPDEDASENEEKL